MKSNLDAMQAAQKLLDNDNILILIHAKPDGDAVGSGFALLGLLTRLGKNAILRCADRLAPRYDYIANQNYREKAFFGVETDFKADLIVSADVASPMLLGALSEQYGDKIDLCIDHHGINTIEATCGLIIPTASAAGEVILDIVEEMSKLLERDVLDVSTASAIFCAIASDTCSFRYGNTTSKTLIAGARLKEAGADTELICRILFESRSVSGYKLCGIVIDNTQLLCDGKLAVSTISLEELAKVCADERDIEGASNFPREIAGVEVGILIRQINDNSCKASFRANGDVNVAEICRLFGGGGHTKAAGCVVSGSIDTVKEALIAEASKCF